MSTSLVRLLVVALALLGLSACTGGSPAPVPCDQQQGEARDLCHLEELKAPALEDPAAARVIAEKIADPIIRSAAVVAWIRAHPRADMQASVPLCALLEGTERNACERRMQSPHLHR